MMMKEDCFSFTSSQNVYVKVTHGSRSSNAQVLKNVYVNVTHDDGRRLLLIFPSSQKCLCK
jgi:hypothetical protein